MTAVLATVIDQLTKWWALVTFADGHILGLLPGVSLRLVFNPGVAFGLGAEFGAPLVIGLFLVLSGLVIWVVVRIRRREGALGTLALAAAAGGGVGNLIDRVFRAEAAPLSGHVVDFIAIEWFAILNVADIFTTCGIALWAISSAIGPRDDRTRPRKEGQKSEI
ncbi:signal peptidase II [Naasia lichenicola]|uniref:Lipoprotein signal peptidase n=1 Tax=Naasia lichenicola TaxID=2565933 RepID=A0A4S4FMC2_9MICO|nr:signal peptidase II [Naasia lichenicola]THG31012.1 signal peptidase II [Naasia lichenicola]